MPAILLIITLGLVAGLAVARHNHNVRRDREAEKLWHLEEAAWWQSLKS